MNEQTITDNLIRLGLTLPTPGKPKANYESIIRSGNQLYISGQVSENADGLIKGRLGETLDVDQGQKAAEACGLMILARIANSAEIPLHTITRILKLNVMVNSTPDFTDQPLVANGASDLLVNVLGDKGRHTRSAFGVATLPLGVAVEIDAIIDL